MRFSALGVIYFLAFLMPGCTSVMVKTDYDPEYNFKNFQTYRWAAENEINPDDANSMGIVNGAKVKISSRRGSVVMKASINGRGLPPQGMVFVPFLKS